MPKLYIVPLLLCSLLSSCSRHEKWIELTHTKDIQIKCPAFINGTGINNAKYYPSQTIPNGLALFSSNDNFLYFFDLDAQQYIKKVDINSLHRGRGIRDFLFINRDTVVFNYVYQPFYMTYSLAHGIIDSFSIDKPQGYPQQFTPYGGFNGMTNFSDMYCTENDQLVVQQGYFANRLNLLNYIDVFQLPLLMPTEAQKIKCNTLPNYNKIWAASETNYAIAYDTMLVFNYYELKDFRVINLDTHKAWTKSSPASQYATLQTPIDTNKMEDPTYSVSYHLTSSGYTSLLWDKYHEVFIRVFESKSKRQSFDNPFFDYTEEKPFSLMFYDKDLNFLNEIKFPEGIYDYTAIIPTPQGILINKNNEKNPKYDNRYLQYDLFTLKKHY